MGQVYRFNGGEQRINTTGRSVASLAVLWSMKNIEAIGFVVNAECAILYLVTWFLTISNRKKM